MFKRRKPDEPLPGVPSPPLPTAAPGSSANQKAERTDALSRDSDISVPPFRPAVAAKDPAIMSRPPLQPGIPSASTMPHATARPGAVQPPRPMETEEPARRTLVVGRGISVQGTVTECERLVVEGTVDSTLIQATEIEIAIGGMFKGGVEVEDAVIAGTIDGTVTARGSLIVKSTGRVVGTAHCRRLQVEDGGQITGQIQMMTGHATSDLPARPSVDATTP